MSTKEQLLERLEREPGNFISGERLAVEIGVSRNAVWKAATSLRKEGYLVDACTNRGYALRFDADHLSPTGILTHLRHRDEISISVRRTVDSTNTWARNRALEGATEGTALIAEGQTAGRGRRGRAFFSPEGSGVYLSVLLRPSIDPARAYLLTCAAAVAVARAIERVCDQRAQIKWVNDIYCDGKKVAGILTEGAYGIEDSRFDYAVVGIGINVREPESGWPGEIAGQAGTLLTERRPAMVRCRLAAAVLDEFWTLYTALPEDTFADEYRKRCFLLGRMLTATAGKRTLRGRAIDLDDGYRLIIEKRDGSRHALSFGDVSVSW